MSDEGSVAVERIFSLNFIKTTRSTATVSDETITAERLER